MHITLRILKSRLRVLSLKSMYADPQTAQWRHQPVSPQCVIQHFSWFEWRMGETSPETIVFKVSKLPYLEVTDNMKICTGNVWQSWVNCKWTCITHLDLSSSGPLPPRGSHLSPVTRTNGKRLNNNDCTPSSLVLHFNMFMCSIGGQGM